MSTPNEQRTAEAALDSLKQIALYSGDPDGIEELAGTILSAITASASPDQPTSEAYDAIQTLWEHFQQSPEIEASSTKEVRALETLTRYAHAPSASPVGQDALAALNLGRDHLRYLLANNSGWAGLEGTPDVIHEMGQALASASRAGGAADGAVPRTDALVNSSQGLHIAYPSAVEAFKKLEHELNASKAIAEARRHEIVGLNVALAAAKSQAPSSDAVEEAIGRLDSEARRAQIYANVSVYDLRLVIDALRAATKPQASEGGAHE